MSEFSDLDAGRVDALARDGVAINANAQLLRGEGRSMGGVLQPSTKDGIVNTSPNS